ncbi:MAG: response regulator transcription factor, partial [Treponema sp.]
MQNVIIVDDHIMLREGLKAWLKANSDWRVRAEAGTAGEFFAVLSDSGETGIDAVIVDVSVGKDNGFDIVCRTRSLYPALNCLIYSMYDSAGYVFNAFKAGAKGYVSKGASEQELLAALNAVAAGKTYVQQSLVPEMAVTADLFSGMTKKEKEVLEQIRTGADNKTIARNLGLSLRTVEN